MCAMHTLLSHTRRASWPRRAMNTQYLGPVFACFWCGFVVQSLVLLSTRWLDHLESKLVFFRWGCSPASCPPPKKHVKPPQASLSRLGGRSHAEVECSPTQPTIPIFPPPHFNSHGLPVSLPHAKVRPCVQPTDTIHPLPHFSNGYVPSTHRSRPRIQSPHRGPSLPPSYSTCLHSSANTPPNPSTARYYFPSTTRTLLSHSLHSARYRSGSTLRLPPRSSVSISWAMNSAMAQRVVSTHREAKSRVIMGRISFHTCYKRSRVCRGNGQVLVKYNGSE